LQKVTNLFQWCAVEMNLPRVKSGAAFPAHFSYRYKVVWSTRAKMDGPFIAILPFSFGRAPPLIMQPAFLLSVSAHRKNTLTRSPIFSLELCAGRKFYHTPELNNVSP